MVFYNYSRYYKKQSLKKKIRYLCKILLEEFDIVLCVSFDLWVLYDVEEEHSWEDIISSELENLFNTVPVLISACLREELSFFFERFFRSFLPIARPPDP